VSSIAAWWEQLGKAAYPDASSLTITADSGGSNNPGTRAGGRRWMSGRGKPLENLEVIISLIAATTTMTTATNEVSKSPTSNPPP